MLYRQAVTAVEIHSESTIIIIEKCRKRQSPLLASFINLLRVPILIRVIFGLHWTLKVQCLFGYLTIVNSYIRDIVGNEYMYNSRKKSRRLVIFLIDLHSFIVNGVYQSIGGVSVCTLARAGAARANALVCSGGRSDAARAELLAAHAPLLALAIALGAR